MKNKASGFSQLCVGRAVIIIGVEVIDLRGKMKEDVLHSAHFSDVQNISQATPQLTLEEHRRQKSSMGTFRYRGKWHRCRREIFDVVHLLNNLLLSQCLHSF